MRCTTVLFRLYTNYLLVVSQFVLKPYIWLLYLGPDKKSARTQIKLKNLFKHGSTFS
jgi:hypothetical protein